MKKVYGLRTEFQAHQTLEDFIRAVGALYQIQIDNAKNETFRIWTDIMKK